MYIRGLVLRPPMHDGYVNTLRDGISRAKVSSGAKRGGVSFVRKIPLMMRVGSRGVGLPIGRPATASRQAS